MKNFTKTICLSAILMFVLANAGWGQIATDGDYRTRATGNWDGSSTWQVRASSSWSNTSTPPSLTANIYIQNGHTLTINILTANCNNLNVNTGGIVTIGTNTLQVRGKIRAFTGTAVIATGVDGIFYSGQTSSTNLVNAMITTSGAGILKFIGTTRNITNSEEWAATNTISFATEFALTSDNTGTLQTGYKTSKITISSGIIDMGSNRLAPDNGTPGEGDVTISSGATLMSSNSSSSAPVMSRTGTASTGRSGNLTLSGNLILSGTSPHLEFTTYVINSGSTVEYSKSGTQTFIQTSYTGAATFPTYSNLTLSGTSAKTLSVNTTVNRTLILTSGLLTLGDYNLTLSSSSTISGTPSSSNMIVATGSGELRKTFTTTGSFTFPVGNGGTAKYSPLTLNFKSGSFSSAYAGVKLSNTQHGNNNGSDYIKRYWTVTQSGISGFSCDAAFTYVDADIVGDENNLYCGAWNGSSWTLLNAVNTLTNTLSGTVTSFSEFTGGDQSVLPAELHSFTSSKSANSVLLSWSTAVELNNSGFDIERKKTESSDWQKIGFVQGHGTTNNPQSYSYPDRYLSTGKYNYRLKQIDYNGNYQYYTLGSEVTIGVPKKFEVSQNFPNPFNPVTKINYELPNDSKVSIKVFDMLGREVGTLLDEFKTAGYHTVDFNGSSLSSGMYFYRIKTNEFEAIKKMLLLK